MASQRKQNYRNFLKMIMGNSDFDIQIESILEQISFSNYLDENGFSKV